LYSVSNTLESLAKEPSALHWLQHIKSFSSEKDFDNFPTQSLRGQNQPQQVIFKLPPVAGFKSGFARLIS
jgi:hypothetical protein